jgi:hypothetical protein
MRPRGPELRAAVPIAVLSNSFEGATRMAHALTAIHIDAHLYRKVVAFD